MNDQMDDWWMRINVVYLDNEKQYFFGGGEIKTFYAKLYLCCCCLPVHYTNICASAHAAQLTCLQLKNFVAIFNLVSLLKMISRASYLRLWSGQK